MTEQYALLSVSDKRGIVPFARRIAQAGYGLISTGGTARVLREAGLAVKSVADLTGFPELLDGRVKTLHPKIHAALLARRDSPEHLLALQHHQIVDIRLVVVNLYPFQQTIEAPGVLFEAAIEEIDIGGPAMLRAAAKNHDSLTVVVEEADYGRVAQALEDGGVGLAFRRALALKAFEHSARYDAAIAKYFREKVQGDQRDTLPDTLGLELRRARELRYGENPHQAAGLYDGVGGAGGFELSGGAIEQLHGKALSYNNIVDLDAALELVGEFGAPACAIIKHTNPAGCALGEELSEAYQRALGCDPLSAFGGIVAFNRPVNQALAELVAQHFFELVAAPKFEPAALGVLQKKKNLRLIEVSSALKSPRFSLRATALGYLVQQSDPRVEIAVDGAEDKAARQWRIPTRRKPTQAERGALLFAWKVAKHVKSNAIVLAKARQTVGVGAGQMSRVDAVEVAIKKAREELAGAVLASDAFFPFRDGVDAAAAAGVRAIIQPGGSVRDQEVIDACDEHGIAMIFSGRRHFRH